MLGKTHATPEMQCEESTLCQMLVYIIARVVSGLVQAICLHIQVSNPV